MDKTALDKSPGKIKLINGALILIFYCLNKKSFLFSILFSLKFSNNINHKL